MKTPTKKVPSKLMLIVDLTLQSVIIAPMVISYIYCISWSQYEHVPIDQDDNSGFSHRQFQQSSWLLNGIFFQLFVGAFQLLSAVSRVFRHNSKIRIKYLKAVGVWLISIYLTFTFLDWEDSIIIYTLGIVIPVLMSIFYWGLTLMQTIGKFNEIPGIEKDLSNLDDSDLIVDQISDNHKKRSES